MKREFKKWNSTENDKLKEMVGNTSIRVIAEQMNRTPGGIERKLERLGLYPRYSGTSITAYQLANLLNVDAHTVLRWIRNHDLPHKRKITKFQAENIFIRATDFWEWAKNNKKRINFSKNP